MKQVDCKLEFSGEFEIWLSWFGGESNDPNALPTQLLVGIYLDKINAKYRAISYHHENGDQYTLSFAWIECISIGSYDPYDAHHQPASPRNPTGAELVADKH